jgi:protein phosphatase
MIKYEVTEFIGFCLLLFPYNEIQGVLIMKFYVKAACACDVGNVRKNNEDNFLFNDECLREINTGLEKPVYVEKKLSDSFCVAVFDGMGGENFGETASFIAAQKLKSEKKKFLKSISSEEKLDAFIKELNASVVEKQKQLLTEKMGTTFVFMCCNKKTVKICNIGDSRAYIFRAGELTQLSCDHIELIKGESTQKGGLTQYLGFNTEEVDLDPYITECALKSDDVFLLCSDGLSDMLSDEEIMSVLKKNTDVVKCTEELVSSAKNNGGRDNITVIVCKLVGRRGMCFGK